MVRAVLKSYRKNILREMKDNLSRMVSLFGIVALGVMMLTGLMSFAPSMRIAGQKYYVQQNVFDLRVLSTLGLSEEDIAAIAAVDGVEAVQPVKYQDVEAQWQGQSETAVVRLQQLPADPGADTAENMNRLVLLSGRMPEAPDECVVHVMGYGDPVEPGTVLTLPEDTEHVNRKQFTVVGTVQDPQHFSTDKESSTAGDGQLDDIVFLPEGSLTTDYYTACYLKVKNAGLYDNYSDAYQAAVDDTAARVKAISGAQCTARRAELIEDASAELADARAEYNDKKAEADRQFAEAEQQLADAQAQLDSAKAQLDAGEAELAANKKALPDTMQGGADELVSGEEQLLEFEDQLQQIEMLVNLKKVADPLLGYAETALHNAQKALDEAEPADEEYTDLRDALQKAQDAYDNISGQLNGYQAQLDEGKRQMYAQGLISSPSLSNEQLVTEAKAALRQMKVKLLQGQLQLTTGTATAYTQFDAARTRLDEGWQQYNDGVQQLADSRAEYESRKAEAEQQLADGLAQLNDAEEQVSQIKSGEWYVLDRGSTVSFVTFEQYADRMDAIARVFPVFFFLVAALVATTTMTRMVDENRLQLGTLKALGYSNAKIAGKYLFYALSASVLGSIVGMVIGFVVFPLIIWYAYQMIFSMSTFTLHFYPGMAAASVAISAAVIGFATWNACRASLKEKTAALLLPRAPVAGKRIFLEYITPLWQHMSFSQKTTARNLFRYKKRFFMTVLGVAGCTALLLIGFGIQDSILPIVDKQSGQLTHNDLTISLSDEKALTMEQGLADTLDSSSAIRSWGAFYTKSTTLYNEEGGSADVSIVGAEDDARMTEYFTFRTREFEQMECEFFCKPGTDLDWFAYWKDYCEKWLLSLGINKENLRLRDHEPAELAFYSRATTDIEYAFPFTDWGELWGIADRTNYDLGRHQEASGKSLEYFDPETNEHYIPYVIEPSLGCDRVALAFLCEAYDEEHLTDSKGKEDVRTVLHLHPFLAPFKCAVLPLSKKLGDKAMEIRNELAKDFMVDYDDAGSIGKRYRRQDEIGTPLCITVDFQTVGDDKVEADNCVTVRDRDTMEQIRMHISELKEYIAKKVAF